MNVDTGAFACFLLPKQAQAHAQEREKIDYKELLVKVAWFYLLTHVLNDKIVTALSFRKTM